MFAQSEETPSRYRLPSVSNRKIPCATLNYELWRIHPIAHLGERVPEMLFVESFVVDTFHRLSEGTVKLLVFFLLLARKRGRPRRGGNACGMDPHADAAGAPYFVLAGRLGFRVFGIHEPLVVVCDIAFGVLHTQHCKILER